ncbi:MAG: hypothetical protein SynsKO_20210 [Synoicihabitans sp.]
METYNQIESGAPTSFTRKNIIGLILLWVAGQVLLFWFRPGYLFPPFDQVDMWFYTAYQWNWGRMLQEFGSTYYGARVSWLFMGAALHGVFDPAAANILLKLIFSAFYAGILAWLGLRFRGIAGGCCGVSIAIFSPQVITAIHGDYTDTAVLIYATTSVICIVKSGLSRTPFRWIFLSGIAFTLMALGNLGSVANIGLAIALFHLAWLDRGILFHGKCLAVYAIAAGLTLGVFQGIFYASGATWDLISPQWRLVLKLNDLGTSNPWYIPGWRWMVRATWIAVPVAAFVWGVLVTYFAPKSGTDDRRLIVALTHSLAFAWMVGLILQLRGSQVIGMYYYSSALLALASPLLLLLAGAQRNTSQRSWTAGFFVFGLMGFVSLVPAPLVYLDAAEWLRNIAGETEAVLLLGGGILLVSSLLWRRYLHGYQFGKFAFPGFTVIAVIFYLSIPRSYQHYSYSDRLPERYDLIYQTFNYIDENFAPDTYRLWIDRAFNDSATLAATKLWGYRMWHDGDFPEINSAELSDRTVIAPRPLGTGEQSLVALRERFEKRGLQMNRPEVHQIDVGNGIGFDLLQFSLELTQFDPHAPLPGQPTPLMIAGFEYTESSRYTDNLKVWAHKGGNAYLSDDLSWPTFHREHDIDFAYTNYRPLPTEAQNRRLAVVVYLNHPGRLTLGLVDNHRRKILDWDISSAGRHVKIIGVPADANAYQLRLYSKYDEQTPLPNNIQIFYYAMDLQP